MRRRHVPPTPTSLVCGPPINRQRDRPARAPPVVAVLQRRRLVVAGRLLRLLLAAGHPQHLLLAAGHLRHRQLAAARVVAVAAEEQRCR